jgi:multidrug efflux pump
MSSLAMSHPGVSNSVAFPGLSINGFVNASNTGIAFVTLKPSDERARQKGMDAMSIVMDLNQRFGTIQDAYVAIFPPPPVQGLGTVGGFKLYVEDRASLGFEQLYQQVQNATIEGRQAPALAGLFSSFQVSVPQIDVDVDRERVKTYGIPLTDVFDTLQVYLGSLYANDFNRFGRTYQVNVQAESSFRMQPEQIARLKTRNSRGDMVPLGSVLHGYPAAEINGGPSPGFSSGQAQSAIAEVLGRTLPNGMTFEWTELAYQDAISGNTMFLIFPQCELLVYGVLAAQYESWSLPFAVLLGVPFGVMGAYLGVWLRGQPSDVYVQVGLITVVGLSAKNAILIVEFANALRAQGVPPIQAAALAARDRLRPILMTSLAFIFGVSPLLFAGGAGAMSRHSIGTTVFFGMLVATGIAIVFIPLFFRLLQGGGEPAVAREETGEPAGPDEEASEER